MWRVLRGGSWNNNPHNLRAANRNQNAPGNSNNNTGFRLARTAHLFGQGCTRHGVCKCASGLFWVPWGV